MRVLLSPEDLLTKEHAAREPGYALRCADKELLDIKVLSPKHEEYVEIYRPGGVLLAVLIKNCLDEKLIADTYRLLRTVNGDPYNRPGIIGENARQAVIKQDGTLSQREGQVPKAVMEAYGGKADMLGHYRWKIPPRPGAAQCGPTAWTLRKPDLYTKVLKFVKEINDIYKSHLPNEYEKQMEYVDTIAEDFKIKGTAFTTLYALKNAPTATHMDTFDYPGAFGVMATLGNFQGGEICFPRFRIAIDYQPGDLLLADVHQLHGNFPVLAGERVACVLFVRKGIHTCSLDAKVEGSDFSKGLRETSQVESVPRPFEYTPNFLTKEESQEIAAYLNTLQFHVRKTRWGHEIKRQSLGYIAQNAFNDRDQKEWGTEYADIDTMPEILQRFRRKLSQHAGREVNYISILKYPNSDATINWHNHKEDHWHNSPVWDVTIGPTERRFWAREVANPKNTVTSVLAEVGSLTTLPASMNTTHEHAILKDKTTGVRYSINCKSLPLYAVWDCHAGENYPPDAVYVGRRVCDRKGNVLREGTIFGNGTNPLVSHDGALETEEEFREYAERKMQDPEFRAKVRELRGKHLLCWCVQSGPKRAEFCHARVWLEIANRDGNS